MPCGFLETYLTRVRAMECFIAIDWSSLNLPAHRFNLDRLPVSCVLGPRTRPPPAPPDDSPQESTSSGQKRFKIGAISIATENWGGLGTYQTAQSHPHNADSG
jgi:hypothetical protein